MSDLDILNVDVDNIKQKQYEALRDFMIARLREVATALKAGDLEAVGRLLQDSPAGDGNGTDTQYISFKEVPNTEYGDMGEVLDILKGLKKCLPN